MLRKTDILKTKFQRLFSSREGSTASIFAIALPALMGVGGFATDYAAVSNSKSRLQAVIDSAALSVAREMTVTPTAVRQVDQLAKQYVSGNIPANTPYEIMTSAVVVMQAPPPTSVGGGSGGVAMMAMPIPAGVRVEGSQQISTPFGLIERFSGVTTLTATATARIALSATSNQKICVLALGQHVNSGIFMHNGASINAPGCSLYSNSNNRLSIVIEQHSRIKATVTCARGGITNRNSTLDTMLITDCPATADPLASKVEPVVPGVCEKVNFVVTSGAYVLKPGTYCGGIAAIGSARLTLMDGVYIMKDGPFLIGETAEVTGKGVTIGLTGKSMVRFQDTALVRLSAPSTGPTAGILIWELRGWKPGLNSWLIGGCGALPPSNKKVEIDIDAERGVVGKPTTKVVDPDKGANACISIQSYIQTKLKKVNEHWINSDRAQELTGTIYLPKGLLTVDSTKPIADQSPFTILITNKLDLYDGPVLTLNSDYDKTTVPVPPGLDVPPGAAGYSVALTK